MSKLSQFFPPIYEAGGSVDNKGNVSGSVVCDVEPYEVFVMTITGATTISFSNFPVGHHETIMLVITNGGTDVTWGAEVKWPEGAAPEMSVAGRDRFVFASEDAGVTIDGGLCGTNYA